MKLAVHYKNKIDATYFDNFRVELHVVVGLGKDTFVLLLKFRWIVGDISYYINNTAVLL